ncbi:hypothetical protein PsYK624_067120 [Phanerochaete sordida]|uniref:DUF6534 domain-containing protein n=1 Tax=Phanerochaete sordida TaxID=48140 RepID=A0A9P3GA33_9APHY|nr:hypothetical protein PsYK624_067120 [Phanerochaete sordida]
MTTLLSQKARTTSFKGVTRLVSRLMWMSVNNGTWTALLALIDFALIAGESSTNYSFTALEYPLPVLYLNVVLANLNARTFLQRSGSSLLPGAYGSGSTDSRQRAVRMIPLQAISGGNSSGTANGAVTIHIDRSVALKSDADFTAGQKVRVPQPKWYQEAR